MVSKFSGISNTLTTSTKNSDTVNNQFILTKPLKLVDKSIKSRGKVVNLNSGVYQLPSNSSKLLGDLNAQQLLSNESNAEDFSKSRKYQECFSNSCISNTKIQPSCNTDDIINVRSLLQKTEIKSSRNVVVIKNLEKKSGVHPKLDIDFNHFSDSDILPLNLGSKPLRSLLKSSSNFFIEESGAVTQSVVNNYDSCFKNETKPFCVISEVIGNADVVFSGVTDSHENVKKLLRRQIITSTETPDTEKEEQTKIDSASSNLNEPEGIDVDAKTHVITPEKSDTAIFDNNHGDENATGVSENEVGALYKVEENNGINANNFSKSATLVLDTQLVTFNGDLIQESDDGFSDSNDSKENAVELQETKLLTSKKIKPAKNKKIDLSYADIYPKSEAQLITPKKTNDITKIKGWRRKQFLVEKPTTVEFYTLAKGSKQKKIKVKDSTEDFTPKTEEPGTVENAFICDSLDEFLDGEVKLKIGYEVPHLYAEVGIKLTSQEIVSKPNLSEKDFKEVETRYCLSVPETNDISDLDKLNEKCCKNGKRSIESEAKPLKFLKLEESKKRPVRFFQKCPGNIKFERTKNLESKCFQEFRKNETVSNAFSSFSESVRNIKFESKLLGLVVYPGPFKPVHPIVQYHIEKLRSYSTRIDKNWANFAASAVLVNDKHYKRRILPVYCCVKVQKNAKALCDKSGKKIKTDFFFEKDFKEDVGQDTGTIKCCKKKIKLKECWVVIDKINLVETLAPWCMEHHIYDCKPCGLSKTKFKNLRSLIPPAQKSVKKINKQNKESKKCNILPHASFDVKIANLLARKIRDLKFRGDTLTSIDSLKTLAPDNIEFIKLNFVKESFLNSYISIWYLKQKNPWSRSRAFLTFSKTPPVPNAINLKSRAFSVKNLPKVITEIVSSSNVFSPNEYAILHSNGRIWEIHGSVNIAFEKSDKNVEQIFATLHLPELEQLQRVGKKILKVKGVKWWVLDLTQKFRLLEVKFDNLVAFVARSKFVESAKCDFPIFVPIKKAPKGRVMGVFFIRSLLPFVLMGPYYLIEAHNMTLKGEFSTLPFMYFVKKNVTKDFPLKFFINSVIKDVEENGKVLSGLWLYDKMSLDGTSYLEVLTRNSRKPVQNNFASINIDHGYSLNSLTKCLPPGVTAGVVKRKDGQEKLKKIVVYLYFDITELGYVVGELQRDNSVVISHPLDQCTKVKSHKVGDWFVRTIKRRIEFIPKNMEVKWFITKYKGELRERRPFNKFLLGGAHVLTKNGVFYLLEMSESKIEKLGLEKNEVLRAITESQVIKVVIEMKNLSNLLSYKSDESLSMGEVLTMAINEIQRLKSSWEFLKNKKNEVEREKLKLASRFFQTLGSCRVDDQCKLKFIKNIEHLFIKTNGDLNEEFMKILKKCRIGQKYCKQHQKFDFIKKIKGKDTGNAHAKVPQETSEEKEKILSSLVKKKNSSEVKILIEKSTTLKGKSPNIVPSIEETSKFFSTLLKVKKINPAENEVTCFKNISPEESNVPLKFQKRNAEGDEIKYDEIVDQSSKNTLTEKGDGFLTLTSSELSGNIKLCWENWKS